MERRRKKKKKQQGQIIIAPSILSADFSCLDREIRKVERAGCHWLHLDIMDGHFVPNITIGPPVVKKLRQVAPSLYFDAHLMVANPDKYIQQFIDAGCQCLTVHKEACQDLKNSIDYIKRAGIKAGVSVRPHTPLSTIEKFLKYVDLVLIMTVEPGFGAQELIPNTLNKVRELRLIKEKKEYKFLIQVDGGINPETVPLVITAGAEVLVVGSYIFAQGQVRRNIQAIKRAVEAIPNYKVV